ncbi:MAG: hypothetical protein U0935_03370 [Pirellulales bacterium]
MDFSSFPRLVAAFGCLGLLITIGTAAAAAPPDPRPLNADADSDTANRADDPELLDRLHTSVAEAVRRLAAGDAGPATQAAQGRVVETLEILREAARRREAGASSSGSGGGTAAGSNSASRPATAETAADRGMPKPTAPQTDAGNASGAWGRLPAREQAATLQLLRERGFPARYRSLLDRYYRSLPRATSQTKPEQTKPEGTESP